MNGIRGEIRFCSWQRRSRTVRGSVHHNALQQRPWVLFVHGFTGHRIGPNYLYVRLARMLFEQGVSSLRYDCPGCGESDGAFADATLSEMIDSIIGASAVVRRRYRPSRIILCGHSLGGAAATLAAPHVKAAGLILLAPLCDTKGIVQRYRPVLEQSHHPDALFEHGSFMMKPSFLVDIAKHDPLSVFDEGYKGDLLLFQGDEDRAVSVRESGRYVHRARRRGVPCGYHLLGGVDHQFSSARAIAFLGRRMAQWIQGNG